MSTNILNFKELCIGPGINDMIGVEMHFYELSVTFIVYNTFTIVFDFRCLDKHYRKNKFNTIVNYSAEELFQESLLPEYNYIDINLILELQKISMPILNDYSTKYNGFTCLDTEGKIIEY